MILLIISFINHFVCRVKALKMTNNSGLQGALDWLEKNGDNEAVFLQDDDNSVASEEAKPKTCLKCQNCGKKFLSVEQAELHASRTSHDDFVEAIVEPEDSTASSDMVEPEGPVIKLTEEEKTARLAELRAKLAIKKAEREREAREADVLRKASSKELEEIRREMELKEMKKLAEERRREKIEDRKRRDEIKRQIEEDRKNKKASIEAEKQHQQQVDVSNDSIVTNEPKVPSSPGSSSPASVPLTARIQVKMATSSKPPLKLTFTSPATETLRDLKVKIVEECGGSLKIGELMQTFPTRVFTVKDDELTLVELGFVPSATLQLK